MQRRDFVKMLFGLPFVELVKSRPVQPPPCPPALLLETPVVGFQYYEGVRLWPRLNLGDPVTLVREPDNPHDAKAIALYWQGEKLGYIPRCDNAVIANLMDQGTLVSGHIRAMLHAHHQWEKLIIGVHMGSRA